jgi:hypothetical protein
LIIALHAADRQGQPAFFARPYATILTQTLNGYSIAISALFGDLMRRPLIALLLSSGILFAQAAPAAQSNPAPATPSVTSQAPAEVPPTAPVITLHGLCPDKPAGTDPKAPDCQTVVTRAEFEHLANTLSPNMPPTAKQSLANDYARMLVVSNEARRHGLENTQHYNDLLAFLKMQLLAQELLRSYQEQAKPSAADVEKYYNDNASKYEEISLKRLFIPRNRPQDAQAPAKAGTPPTPPTDAELLAEGEKIRSRLVAGGDFEKIEKEVYESAGFKTPPPPTSIPNWRREAVPPTEQHLFELKPKEFSKVLVEPAGAYIYQLEEKKTMPLAEVKPQIESMMTNERLRTMIDGLMGNVKPEVNQAYFRTMGAETASPAPVSANTPVANRPAAANAAVPSKQTPKRAHPASPTPK